MKRYPGVSPFSAEQSNIFYGRDNDIDKLKKLILLRKQILLYSKSGIGKTSLLNAGILPSIEDKFCVLKIRFFAYNKTEEHYPINSVFESINSKFSNIKDPNKTILDKIVENIELEKTLWFQLKKRHLLKPAKFILIFDQFEELFSYPAEQIEVFKNQLHELLYIDVPDTIMQLIARDPEIEDYPEIDDLYEKLEVKTVFSIRSDRLSLLNKLTDKIPDIQKTFYELNPLDIEQAKHAIINPAANNNSAQFELDSFKYSSDAIDSIISALSNKGFQSIESTQLQIVCQRIEAIAKQKQSEKSNNGQIEITQNDLPKFKNIFLTFYEESVNETNEPEIARKFIEDQLIRNNQRISLDSIICKDFVKPETLQILVNTHLLRAERNSTNGFSYELSHDSLIDPIQDSAKIRREKEEEQKAKDEQIEKLRLSYEKAKNEDLERIKEKKRQQTILTIVGVAAIISIALSVFAVIKMNQAQELTKRLYTKEAVAHFESERFLLSRQKYIYLRDTLNVNTTSINQRIDSCIIMEKNRLEFYYNIYLADSLIKTNRLINIINADSLLNATLKLNYYPGRKLIQSKISSFNDLKKNVITSELEKARMYMTPEVHLFQEGREILENINKLNPENQEPLIFSNKN